MGVPPDPKNPRDAGSYGPKLYCISGHVNKPGCVELPLGVTVRELIDKHGGGVWKGRKAKGCIPGGISMGFMTEKEFDTPLDFNGPGKVGCLGLGTAAVTVFDEETSIVDVLYNICRFFAHESCGQCTPCREGTGWMLKIVDRIRRGQGRLEDLQILEEVGDVDRHHAGHDHLRPGRRRRLAGQERRPQVPRRSSRSTSAAGSKSTARWRWWAHIEHASYHRETCAIRNSSLFLAGSRCSPAVPRQHAPAQGQSPATHCPAAPGRPARGVVRAANRAKVRQRPEADRPGLP